MKRELSCHVIYTLYFLNILARYHFKPHKIKIVCVSLSFGSLCFSWSFEDAVCRRSGDESTAGTERESISCSCASLPAGFVE